MDNNNTDVISALDDFYAEEYFKPIEAQFSPEASPAGNTQLDDSTVEPCYDHTLLEDQRLLSDSSSMFVAKFEGDEWKPYSSDICPKGLTDDTFKRFAFFLFEYFNQGQFIGSKLTKSVYAPPEAIYFKGSSVTCLKYENQNIEGGLKTFGPESDYDVGLVSQAGIDAMNNLASRFDEIKSCGNVKLANKLSAFQKKVYPRSGNYLDIHNKDKNSEDKNNLGERKFFPDGTPHILFCEALNTFVGAKHPFNFVMVSDLASLKYSHNLVMSSDNITNSKGINFLSQCEERIQDLRHSDHTKWALTRHEFKVGEDHRKPVLVYSWNLLKVYHNKFCEQFPTEATEAKKIFANLQAESTKQKGYCASLVKSADQGVPSFASNAQLFKPKKQTQTNCSNTNPQPTSRPGN